MKFQKIKDTYHNIEYGWMLVLETTEDVLKFDEKVFHAKIRHVWDNITATINGKAHIDNQLGSLVWHSHREGESIVEATVKVLNRITTGKLKCLTGCGKIYQGKEGGYFGHHKDIQVLEEMFTDGENVIFPEYTKDDIRTKQWEGGKHWYAYVGDIWVEDIYGNKKFDTQQRAREVAEYNLYKLHNKQFEFKNK